MVDGTSYKARVEANDSTSYDLLTNRSDSSFTAGFIPQTSDYSANRLLVGYAGIYNRFTATGITPPSGIDIWLNVNTPAAVTSISLLNSAGAVVYTFNLTTDRYGTDFFKSLNSGTTPATLASGPYTIRFLANGITHNVYTNLTVPVAYPIPDTSTMQAEHLSNGDIRFSWASVDHTGALYYRINVEDTTTGVLTASSRLNQTYIDMTAASLGNLATKRWRVEVQDSNNFDTQRNRSISSYTAAPLTPVAYDATRPVINSFRVRNMNYSNGDSVSQLMIGATDSDGTITQRRVDGPSGYTRNVSTPDSYTSGAYNLTETGSLASGLYTFTAVDNSGKRAVRYKFQPAPHAIPAVDYHTFQIDLESSGDPRISWAPVVSDVPIWYYLEVWNASSLTPVTIPSSVTAGTMMQQTSVTVPAAYMTGQIMFRILAFDDSNSTTYNNVSRSVMVGYQPGLDYSALTDAEHDGYASTIDANDNDININPFTPSTSTLSTTKAKVYLGLDDIFTVSNSGTTLYGGAGNDTVTIAAGVTGISLDQNVDRVNLLGTSSSYTFKQTGNKINVYDSTGATLLASIPVQGDADGTVIGFSNGYASAQLAGGVMTLGGATVSPTPTTLSPALQ